VWISDGKTPQECPLSQGHCNKSKDLVDCGRDLAEWLERLTVDENFATFLGSIPASSDTVESERAAYQALLNKAIKNPLKKKKKSPFERPLQFTC
jgi:hypothetical protein